MKFEISSRWYGSSLFSLETETLKLCVEAAVKHRVNLYGANLSGANLSRADLSGADLYRADLYRANLSGANLSGANLYRANLSGANLYRANLSRADLYRADLSGANLYRANLSRATIFFNKFPSIRVLSSINLGKLSDALSLELMRRDAAAHPYPERFDEWARGGNCPYQNEERFWIFDLNRDLWKPGKPELTDVELIRNICNSKGWGIKET